MPPEQIPMNWNDVQTMLDGLPPGIPLLPEKERNNFFRYRNPPARVYGEGQAWKQCQQVMDGYDGYLCRGYREEIDTLLVFAGLFSAVVTAFTIESYQWLQDDQTETVVSLLTQIAQSVAANASAVHLPPVSAGMPHSVSIRVNVYWFLALSLSLSAALVGILGKQWLREFERREAAAPREAVGLRQNKFDGFQAWRVGEIISTLPLLLQISLALFAAGIIELLWQLHSTVAIAICVPTAAAVLFYLATSLFPVIEYNRCWWWRNAPGVEKVPLCPYRSPQALLMLRAYAAILSICVRLVRSLGLRADTTAVQQISLDITSWGGWDRSFTAFKDRWFSGGSAPRSSIAGLVWLKSNIQNNEMMECIFSCLWEEGTYDTGGRARRDIEHLTKLPASNLDNPAPTALALSLLTQSGISAEFAGEVLLQNMTYWDISTVTSLLKYFTFRPLSVGTDIMKNVIVFCSGHIHEDIGELLETVTNLLIYPADAVESNLRACMVYAWLDWIATFHSSNGTSRLRIIPWPLLEALAEMYVSSPDEGEPYIEPGVLDALPYVWDLATVVRTVYEEYPPVECQWPLLEDWKNRFWGIEERTAPVVFELLRISVLGVSPDDRGPSLHSGDNDAASGEGATSDREDGIQVVRPGAPSAAPAARLRQTGGGMATLEQLNISQSPEEASARASPPPVDGSDADLPGTLGAGHFMLTE